jgi:hypothetical protein
VSARTKTRLLTLACSLALLAALALATGARQASAATRSTVARRTTVKVQITPGIKGVRFTLDGRTFLTDSRGRVTIATFAGIHRIGVALPRSLPRGMTVRFAGWLDHYPGMQRTVKYGPRVETEQIGFIVSYPVSVVVADASGRRLPASTITRITLASSLGERFTLVPGQPAVAFAANRIARDKKGLVAIPIRYSTREVIIDGANVVNKGSENFFAPKPTTWTIHALLFPLTIEVRDAFFGFAIGSSVRLTYPSGARTRIDLGPDHATRVANLPRGTYQLVAKGSGMGLSSPLSLSKPQKAKLLLLSWVDFAAVGAFAVLFIIGLPILGGRIIRRSGGARLPAWRTGGRQDVAPKAEPSAAPLQAAAEVGAERPVKRPAKRALGLDPSPVLALPEVHVHPSMEQPAPGTAKTPKDRRRKTASRSTSPKRVEEADHAPEGRWKA